MSSNPSEPKAHNNLTKRERVTFAMAAAALIVSLLALWDSHENSNVARAEAAPHLKILNATFTRPDPADPQSLALILVLTNTGKIGVRVNEVEMHPAVLPLPGDNEHKGCFDDLDKATFKSSDLETKISPAEEGVPRKNIGIESMIVRLPVSCSDTGWKFVGSVDFKGADDARHDYDSKDSSDEALFSAVVPKT
jgi:hypothetical protein